MTRTQWILLTVLIFALCANGAANGSSIANGAGGGSSIAIGAASGGAGRISAIDGSAAAVLQATPEPQVTPTKYSLLLPSMERQESEPRTDLPRVGIGIGLGLLFIIIATWLGRQKPKK